MDDKEKDIENQPVESKRSLLAGRMKDFNAEGQYDDDDEALYGDALGYLDKLGKDVAERDERIKGYEDVNSRFSAALDKNPEAAVVITGMVRGDHPLISFVEAHGLDGLRQALEDASGLDEVVAADKKYHERQAKGKQLQEEVEGNIQKTIDDLTRWGEDENVDDDDIDKCLSLAADITENAEKGIYSPEHMSILLKAVRHDDDVKCAAEEAEVRGRNAKIKEQLRKPDNSDGVPALSGGDAGPDGRRGEDEYGALDRNFGRADIWERGGLKRTRHNR